MCRFLLSKFSEQSNPIDLLIDFAQMCRESKSLDGDDQGDGWGLAYQNNGQWQHVASLDPIWQDLDLLREIPKTNFIVAHARSASFPHQRGIIEYNQPFISGEYVFVFNGMIKGVELKNPVPGKIGSQKIWHLIQTELKKSIFPAQALKNVFHYLQSNSKEIVALNVALASTDDFWTLCSYKKSSNNYYQLQQFENKKIKIVCSEILPGFKFKPIEPS